ncbi:hypothetical protein CC86DRAFT_5981 [Ophiobolus disseminans]|uniref:Uncharacterized protein n=1 Tax=Ophiobolus disseminans TaxID=1469910 RepID=A0A6A7AKB9_9PLEO|nr:hypothetical protein CC86DRAFT_5981 [Ophiobolus disseminans]
MTLLLEQASSSCRSNCLCPASAVAAAAVRAVGPALSPPPARVLKDGHLRRRGLQQVQGLCRPRYRHSETSWRNVQAQVLPRGCAG